MAVSAKNDDILIYGTQYYRWPTPLPSQWENDLAGIAEHGFNTVKIWAQWRTNCGKEGEYDFSDISRLMDLASDNGLNVIINIIMDAAPAWLYEKYPHSLMITASGEKIRPRSLPHRQAGGAPGPCYHHKAAAEEKYRFIAALAETFADHPALLYWDLWNEPELTCAVARDPDAGRMTCYCKSSVREFRRWLKDKYGTVERLNGAWKRNYESFAQAEPPRGGSTYKDMIDWRMFFADTLTRDLKKRVEVVKRYDSRHPVMVHTVPMPYFNMINACCDDYAMAELCDMYGNSLGNQPLTAAMAMSSAKGKTVINAEVHAVPGDSFSRPAIQSLEDFRRQIYVPLARGIKGFVYWQYRPELCGREGPAWGLTELDGSPGFRLGYAEKIGRSLQKYADLIVSVRPEPAKIAVIRDYKNEIFTWCARDRADEYYRSVEGAFRAFYSLNCGIDVLTVRQAVEKGLDSYKLVYYPSPYYMEKETALCLREYVEKGGTLAAEANFGAYCGEDNLHSMTVPGYGFDKVFGARESKCVSTAYLLAAYGDRGIQADSNIIDISGGPRGSWKGYLFAEELEPDAAEIIGVYKYGGNTMPILTVNGYGRGKAVMCGTLLGAAYALTGDKGTLGVFEKLIDIAGVQPYPCHTDGVRVDLLRSEKGIVIVADNQSGRDSELRVPVPDGIRSVSEIESDQRICAEENAIKIRIESGNVRVYAGMR